MAKEELAIEVAEVDRVQIDNVNLAETAEHEILEQLTSYTASTDKKYSSLLSLSAHFDHHGICTSSSPP